MLELASPLLIDEAGYERDGFARKLKICEEYYAIKKDILSFFRLDTDTIRQMKLTKINFEEK